MFWAQSLPFQCGFEHFVFAWQFINFVCFKRGEENGNKTQNSGSSDKQKSQLAFVPFSNALLKEKQIFKSYVNKKFYPQIFLSLSGTSSHTGGICFDVSLFYCVWKLFKTQTVFCAKHKYSVFMIMDFYGKEFMLSLWAAIFFYLCVYTIHMLPFD